VQGSAIVNDDVAVVLGGSECRTGVWVVSRGEQGDVGQLQDRFIEQMTHFDRQVCSLSYDLVCWAVEHPCALFMAWLAISKVGAAVWVLVVAQVVIFRLFGSGVVAVVDGDVAASLGGSRCETGGCGGSWSAVGQPGIQCQHS
jgi:hypothetical protein